MLNNFWRVVLAGGVLVFAVSASGCASDGMESMDHSMSDDMKTMESSESMEHGMDKPMKKSMDDSMNDGM